MPVSITNPSAPIIEQLTENTACGLNNGLFLLLFTKEMDLTVIVGMDQMDLVVMIKIYQTLKLEFMS